MTQRDYACEEYECVHNEKGECTIEPSFITQLGHCPDYELEEDDQHPDSSQWEDD